MSQALARTVFAFTALFFAAFFLWPVLQILRGGFVNEDGRLTLSYQSALLSDPLYLGGLLNSFLLATAATTLALLIALPLAVVSDRFLFPGKALLGSVVLIPMILPPFVGAIGIKQIFGQYGALNALIVGAGLRPAGWTFDWFAAHQFWGIAIVEALSLYPIIYLNALAALANVDPAMEEAAQNLGCTGFRRFRRITLPLIKPGLFAGGTIVFIWAFTELGTPLVFDYAQVTSVQIFYGLKDIGGWDGLVKQLGGPDRVGIGFAAGIERLVLALPETTTQATPARAFVVALGEEARAEALRLLRELRAAGIPAEMEFEARSMKAQLKRADRVQAAVAVIVGGDELARGEVTLRDMRKSEQRAVARASAVEAVRTTL